MVPAACLHPSRLALAGPDSQLQLLVEVLPLLAEAVVGTQTSAVHRYTANLSLCFAPPWSAVRGGVCALCYAKCPLPSNPNWCLRGSDATSTPQQPIQDRDTAAGNSGERRRGGEDHHRDMWAGHAVSPSLLYTNRVCGGGARYRRRSPTIGAQTSTILGLALWGYCIRCLYPNSRSWIGLSRALAPAALWAVHCPRHPSLGYVVSRHPDSVTLVLVAPHSVTVESRSLCGFLQVPHASSASGGISGVSATPQGSVLHSQTVTWLHMCL